MSLDRKKELKKELTLYGANTDEVFYGGRVSCGALYEEAPSKPTTSRRKFYRGTATTCKLIKIDRGAENPIVDVKKWTDINAMDFKRLSTYTSWGGAYPFLTADTGRGGGDAEDSIACAMVTKHKDLKPWLTCVGL